MTKQLISTEWLTRLVQEPQLVVGFSGGLDSTVLLHALSSQPQLHEKLLAVHVNHGISANAHSWQTHCQDLCQQWNLDFIARTVEFNRTSNIEAQARTARYEVFTSVLQANSALVLAHHLDDQAETVLLQLFRGAGVDGLAAMMEVGLWGNNRLYRPLLTCSRLELEQYAAEHQLTWIEDESNEDISYSRNYLRQKVMPLLAQKWPGVVGNIARAAKHNQQAKVNLDDLALLDNPDLVEAKLSLAIEPLKHLSVDRTANVLRVWLKKNQVQAPPTATFQRLIDELINANVDTMPLVAWDKVQVRRYRQNIYLQQSQVKNAPQELDWPCFPKPLNISELNITLETQSADSGLSLPPQAQIQVKFRRGGEILTWHGQSKSLKKLFQDWGIPPWLRDTIPLLYINNTLAAVIGYAISDLFYTPKGTCLELKIRSIDL